MFDMFIKHVNIICLHGSAHIGGQQCMTDARRFSEALCLLQQGAGLSSCQNSRYFKSRCLLTEHNNSDRFFDSHKHINTSNGID